MRKKYTKIISALIAALMLFLPSCVTINRPIKVETDTETENAETEVPRRPYDYDIVENDFIHEREAFMRIIGDADFGGSSFMIATPKASLIDGDAQGEASSQMAELRRREVEEKFNVEIFTKTVDPDTMFDSVRAAVMTDDYFADLLMIPQNYVASFASEGILFNLNSMPFADFKSGFNIESGTEAAMAYSEGWALAGWASLDPDTLPAVFFNKELIKEAGLEDPYELVRSGAWTWDEFFSCTAAISSINDGRAASGESAVSTYGSGYLDLTDSVFFSENNRFIAAGLGSAPYIAMDWNDLSHTTATLQTLGADWSRIDGAAESAEQFAAGNAIFLFDRLGTMKSISNSPAVWGILPMPKRDADQSGYVSLAPSDSLMFALPANTSTSDKASRVLSALNICSLGYVIETYLTDSMYHYIRDNDSLDSIEKLCYGVRYDMAYTFGGYDGNIAECTFSATDKTYAGESDLQYCRDTFGGAADAALSRLFS